MHGVRRRMRALWARAILLGSAACFVAACQTQPAQISLPAAANQEPQSALSKIALAGRVLWPEPVQAPPPLWVRKVSTDGVQFLPVSEEGAFSGSLPAGAYELWYWLPDYSQRGTLAAATAGHPDDPAGSEWLQVGPGTDLGSLEISDWEPSGLQPLLLLGRFIDGTGAAPVEDGAILIVGERIAAVGGAGQVEVPTGATVIRTEGTTTLPGFINAHVHNTYNRTNRRIWAQAGVTTVRDMGERLGVPWFTLADRLNRDPELARAVCVGPLVTVPGGYPIAGNDFPSLTVESPEDARSRISQLIQDGADAIKITLTFGRAPTLSLEEARAIVETAHQQGIPVTVHATELEALQRALDAGVDDIGHIVTDRVPDSLIERMVVENVAWVPTFEALRGQGKDNLRRFVAAGGRVALGNDSGYLSGLQLGMPMREIAIMHEAGLTPMHVLMAGTRDAAFVCRRLEALGTLEPGKLADLLVVRGDPLDDLNALTDVLLVIRSGTVIRDER